MSQFERLREFIRHRLSAAAEEIFSEFEKTIEEELSAQLEDHRKGQIRKRCTELRHDVLKEEPEAPQVKENQDGLCIRQEAELGMKEESEAFTVSSAFHVEPEPMGNQVLLQSAPLTEGKAEEKSAQIDSAEQRDARVSGTTWENAPVLEHRFYLDPERMAWNVGEETSARRPEAHRPVHPGELHYGNQRGPHELRPGEKPHACSFCGKAFKQKKKLIQHLRTHTDERPFSCSWCQKAFHQRAHLNSHIRIHTGEKPYVCAICHKRFRDTHTHKRHVRVHTGEKPYSCPTCGEMFSRRDNLLIHTRNHAD